MEGVHQFFEYLEGKRYKLHVRVMLSRYRTPVSCSSCTTAAVSDRTLAIVKIAGRISMSCLRSRSNETARLAAQPSRSLRYEAAGRQRHSSTADGQAWLSPPRRTRLSDALPSDPHALGRRGPTGRLGQSARRPPGRHALRARRTDHRPSSARHRDTRRHSARAGSPGQYGGRRRTRPPDDAGSRLSCRAGPVVRREGRRGHLCCATTGIHCRPAIDHGALSARRGRHRNAQVSDEEATENFL